MICQYCKYATFELTPKTLKRAKWGKGKCMATWERPTIDILNIPTVVKVTLTISEPVIDQDLISLDDPELDEQYGVQRCPLFEC